MIKKDYLIYVHNLRGLAILIIVAIHTRLALFSGENLSTLNKFLMVFLDNGTIIFVFISGFLFHHVFIPNFNFQNYLITKTRYVLLPYTLISIVPIIDKLFIENNIPWMTSSLEAAGPLGQSAFMLLSGKHFGPFWFIPMIAIYYLIAPLLIKINKRSFYLYLFPLIFIAGLFTYKFGYYSTILNSFIFFLPIYLLGMMVSRYKEIVFKHQNWFLPILLMVYTLGVIMELKGVLTSPKLTSFNMDDHPYFIFNPAKLRFSILAVVLFIFFKMTKSYKFRVLKILGNYSFGIYFIHLFFIILAQKTILFYQIEVSRNLGTFFIFTFYTVFSSLTFVWAVKSIFKSKSRLLIGS